MNDPAHGPRRFLTTRWTRILAAGEADAAGRDALEELCTAYWPPLYAFARRSGADLHEAEDLVQGFFADLLARGGVQGADRGRGRFRTWLLAAYRHYASKRRAHDRAEKRGGGRAVLSLDFARERLGDTLDPADDATPERAYERRWALTLLERVLARLRGEQTPRGLATFDALAGHLVGGSPVPYAEVARQLGISEGAVKVTVHRLRRRYQDALRDEIAQTVSSPEEVDAEIRDLMAALG